MTTFYKREKLEKTKFLFDKNKGPNGLVFRILKFLLEVILERFSVFKNQTWKLTQDIPIKTYAYLTKWY